MSRKEKSFVTTFLGISGSNLHPLSSYTTPSGTEKTILQCLTVQYFRLKIDFPGARDAVTPVSKVVENCYSGFRHASSWYEEVISWVEAADQEKQLMKLVHEEMSQFFDVVNEKEFKEVVEKYPNSR